MNKCYYACKEKEKRRREEIAFAFFQGYTAKEIVEYSRYSEKAVRMDIKYIEAHPEEFLG